MSNHSDVRDFHQRFGMPAPGVPNLGDPDYLRDRVAFLGEELMELQIAVDNDDLVEIFDALLDLAYVAHGTAIALGLPWEEGWDEVHRTNMAKVPGMSKRGMQWDVTKPAGWTPPDLRSIIERRLRESAAA